MADEEYDLDLVLAEYDSTYLECRDLLHSWRVMGHFFNTGGVTVRLLECQRCGMERKDRPDDYTRKTLHSYDPPEGYRIKGVSLSKADVRAEAMRRVSKVFDSEAALRAAARRRAQRSNVRALRSA